MILKIYSFAILCGMVVILNKTEAQTVQCSYHSGWYRIDPKNENVSQYGCYVLNKNYYMNPTEIGGEHKNDKTDDDVGTLAITDFNLMSHFSSIFCDKFPNLVMIYTKDAQIESIDENALFSCQDLNYLVMKGDMIRSLPKNLLSRQSKLKNVNLFDNLLTTLPEDFFFHQSELEALLLYDSQIDFLPNELFRPLVKLKYLYLHNNKIDSINPEWLVTLEKLKDFSLKKNQIREVPGGVFKSLRNLEKLYLNENNIITLRSDSFEGLDNLLEINLDNNQISELPPHVFTPLSKIKDISLAENSLNIMHSESFGRLDKIENIWLNNNKIKALDERIFDYINKSIYFDFKDNICADFYTKKSKEIKANLKKCFENYQSRLQPTNSVQVPQQQIFDLSSEAKKIYCGKSIAGHPNIVGGTQITKGAFPWIGAIVKIDGKFFCGCTLISNVKVITAAHCIQTKEKKVPTLPREILVLLGVYDLNAFLESGRVSSAVNSIHMHNDWNPFTRSFDADIAVVVLDNPVAFNKNIQPICLIPPGSNILTISQSIVVGFGKSENATKLYENIPKLLENPIHSSEKCYKLSPRLKFLASGRTFCAGLGMGQGVCSGDSGSGVFVEQNETYYLRGVVSSSIIGGPYGCDVNHYAIFTDVPKFYDWINSIPVEESPEFS